MGTIFSKGVLGRVDFREDEKKKMRRENFLESVWLKGREGKNVVGLKCFLLKLTKMFSLQNEKKTKRERV